MIIKEKIFCKNRNVVILAIIATLLWGSAFPCVKIGYALFDIAGDSYSQILFAGVRFVMAGIMVLLLYSSYQRKLPLPDRASIKGILYIGLIQTSLEYIFFYIGLAYTTGVKSSIIYSANPFISVILAHLFYKNEKLNLKKTLGCIAGFAGVILINWNGGELGGGFTFLGEGMILLAAAAFGVGALLSKSFTQNSDSMIITGYQLFLGGIVLVVIGIAGKGSLPVISFAGMMMLFYLALLSAVAFTIWTVLLKYNEVGKITVYNFLIPVFGVILSSAFLGEAFLETKTIVALIFVCLGIYVINKPKKNIE